MRISLLILALAAGSVAYAQDAEALVKAMQGMVTGQTAKLERTADMMPADEWGLVPGEGSRAFNDVVAHIVDAQNNTCGSLVGAGQMPRMEGTGANKTKLMDALKKSNEFCNQAAMETTTANMYDPIQGFRGPTPRLATMFGNVQHSEDMYGQMAVYLRVAGHGAEPRQMGGGKGKGGMKGKMKGN